MSRILLAQSPHRIVGDRRPRHVPCHLAAMEFGFPQPGLSVVIKTRLSFAEGDGPHRIAEFVDAMPFRMGAARADDDRPMGDDLAPHKPETDLLLVGSLDVIPLPSGGALERHLSVKMGSVETRFSLHAERAGHVPLRAPWLRVVGRPDARLGAAQTPDPMELGPSFEEDFDFAVFQAAAPEMRMAELPSPKVLEITGLDEFGDRLTVAFPPFEPRLLVDWRWSGSTMQEVQLLADTIALDLGAATIDVLWRGNLELSQGPGDIDRLILGFCSADAWEQRGFGAILRELPHGRFSHAYERRDIELGGAPPPLGREQLAMAQHEAMEYPQAPEPTLSLAEHARITANLLEVPVAPSKVPQQQSGPTRVSVLEKYGLDEFTWGQEERSLAERLATAKPSAGSIHEDWERELVAALGPHTRQAEHAVIAPDFGELSAQLECGRPDETLEARGLSLGSWLRLDRKWQQQMRADPEVRRQVEAAAHSERQRMEATETREIAVAEDAKP